MALLIGHLESGRFPALAETITGLSDLDFDEAFEFGLRVQLDGIAVLLRES
jgi:hypothetical protein